MKEVTDSAKQYFAENKHVDDVTVFYFAFCQMVKKVKNITNFEKGYKTYLFFYPQYDPRITSNACPGFAVERALAKMRDFRCSSTWL